MNTNHPRRGRRSRRWSAIVAIFIACWSPPLAAQTEDPPDFVRDIAPILRAHCIACHGPNEASGDLRLDARGHVFGVDPDLWTVVPGAPADSELWRRVTLPPGDDDVMPKRRAPLSKFDTLRLREWIEAGAPWPQDVVIPPLPRARDGDLEDPGEAARAARDAAMRALSEAADSPFVVHTVYPHGVALRVRAAPSGEASTPIDLRALSPLAEYVVDLELARTATTDAQPEGLAAFVNLRQLDLSYTQITDAAAAALSTLPRLERLNVVGTRFGDRGLTQLAAAPPSLSVVFAWRSEVTTASAAAVGAGRSSAHPLIVDLGAGFEDAGRALDDSRRAAVASTPGNARCPVSGSPVAPRFALEHGARKLGFCCALCRERFAADPDAFTTSLENLLVGEAFDEFVDVLWLDGAIDFGAADATLLRWWTDTCPFCADSLPALDQLAARTPGLRVVGVYHPKPIREVTPANVRAAAQRIGFGGALVVDTRWRTLRSLVARGLPNRATSVSLLVDRKGIIRWVHPGPRLHEDPDGSMPEAAEGLRELERTIAAVLAEVPRAAVGAWRCVVRGADAVEVPFVMSIAAGDNGPTDLRAVVLNGVERVPIPSIRVDGASLRFGFDAFDSTIDAVLDAAGRSMRGTWQKRRASGLVSMTFEAVWGGAAADAVARFPVEAAPGADVSGRWRVVFAGDEEPAVGVFEQQGDGSLAGTFETTLGDYRFLAGRVDGSRMRLSCFDGAHAFVFDARLEPDGLLRGEFASLPDWRQGWRGERDDTAQLADPWSHTGASGEVGELELLDLTGDTHRLGAPPFDERVRVLVVFGSWCPNCRDAVPLFNELHRRFAERGARIVGLAFEHPRPDAGGDASRLAQLRRYVESCGIEYPVLLAGPSDKRLAQTRLPWLDAVRAYPTFVFVRRDGKVARIYTGFAGPATGAAHESVRREMIATLERLLED